MSILQDKKLLLGITGGIAVYKVCEVLRRVSELGVSVQVAMTRAAQQFVTPLTFETLSSQPVMTDLFVENQMVATRHVEVPREADAVVICPATADFIGKVVNGIADDLLSTMVMVAGPGKSIFCPAMNSDMWANPVVQDNIKRLSQLGAGIVGPEYGELACHSEGLGRLAAVERIVSRLKIALLKNEQFAGMKFLITAGPTEEAIDPIRYITNASSGKMGFALAEAALSRGARVTLISGPTQLIPPDDAKTVFVRSAEEMKKAVFDHFPDSDVVVMAAAVSDYRPAQLRSNKIKKTDERLTLKLKRNTDILAELGQNKGDCTLVGFAVETENEMANASLKMRQKNLDLVVVNNPRVAGAGFQTDTNVVTMITREGEEKSLTQMSKFEVALHIMDEIAVIKGLKPAAFKSTIYV